MRKEDAFTGKRDFDWGKVKRCGSVPDFVLTLPNQNGGAI
jgi:hypothetical protein